MHCLMANNGKLVDSKSDVRNAAACNGNYQLQYGALLDDVLTKRGEYDNDYNNGKNSNNNCFRNAKKKSSALRKAESDNRISFYRENHGLIRTGTETTAASPPVSGKWSCRSRSLSYESIYFKPQESCAPPTVAEPAKSQSFRELVTPGHRSADNRDPFTNANGISKRISRSVSFFRRHCDKYDSDDYDYIEEDCVCRPSVYSKREFILSVRFTRLGEEA